MGDSDAEWVDVDKEFPSAPRPVPRGPTDEPAVTSRPRPFPPGRRPVRPTQRPEAPDVSPDSGASNAVIISVSVISCIIVVALVLLLLYLKVLRKKLQEVEKSKVDSQYCLRVEDVAHLDIDDSSNLYVNTTDLQKLMSTVRIKNKRPPPDPLTTPADSYPDVVRVEKPVLNVPSAETVTKQFRSLPRDDDFHNTGEGNVKVDGGFLSRPKFPPPSLPSGKPSSVEEHSTPRIVRPAPPPPTHVQNSKANEYSEVSVGQSQATMKANESAPPLPVMPKPSNINTPNEHKPVPPHVASKPKQPGTVSQRRLIQKEAVTKLGPEVSLPRNKPIVPFQTIDTKDPFKKQPPPVNPKPKSEVGVNNKPSLASLKLQILPQVERQDSGFSTPDTAITYVTDPASHSPTGNGTTQFTDPAIMSVTAKRAYLEGIIASKGIKGT